MTNTDGAETIKKITPEMLHRCAEKIEEPGDSITDITKELEVDRDVTHLYITSDILHAVANSIEQYYIAVPTDKDRMPTHVGDIVYSAKDFKPFHVQGVMVGDGTRNDNVLITDGDASFWVDGTSVAHTKPDSWEQIINDAVSLGVNVCTVHSYVAIQEQAEIRSRLVARCRKLAGDE